MGLDTIDLILATEKHFKVSVPDARTEKTVTVERYALLLWELQSKSKSPLSYEQVLLQLRQIISTMFDLPIESVVPTANFIKDLRLDQ